MSKEQLIAVAKSNLAHAEAGTIQLSLFDQRDLAEAALVQFDAALELAEQTSPDLVIANDPDADRCAVAIPGPGGWRMLRGDEVGALLGSHLLASGVERDSAHAVFANSIVSSRVLAAMCRAAGVRHEETLTGFKWIGRVEGLRYGYEEALGYCVDPTHVRDKDGVSAKGYTLSLGTRF